MTLDRDRARLAASGHVAGRVGMTSRIGWFDVACAISVALMTAIVWWAAAYLLHLESNLSVMDGRLVRVAASGALFVLCGSTCMWVLHRSLARE